ncbi:hypothetical protein [Thermococcus stetteri]|uniref:hypothetical protein n=1 Tax=Thermococcus stetteri TaxID=49900 RepID=UPI001AE99937|nr:hypothetical protein [Thermococcus stetteri]MBP1912819.1 hypothetical protein [Thermococcus stetteri]
MLMGIFDGELGGWPFGELPNARMINITDFGTGPFIPIVPLRWDSLGNGSTIVTVYAITDQKGNTEIAIGDPGADGMERPNTNRMAVNYLDRIFLEVYTGRNPQTGKEIKVLAFKLLNVNGYLDVRHTAIMENPNLDFSIFAAPSESDVEKIYGP